MTNTPFDPYAVLQVHEEAAEQDVIDAAFRRLSRRLHPDAGGDAEAFKQLSAAHDLLSTPSRRAAYDLDRRRAAEASAGADSTTTTSTPAPTVPMPFVGPVATTPGAGRRHGWWATWLRIEARMARLLATAPLGVSVLTTALGGAVVAYLATSLVTLPVPEELYRFSSIGLATWMAGGLGWFVHRRRSVSAFLWEIRLYVSAIGIAVALSVIHVLAQSFGVLLLVALAILVVRHRGRRAGTAGASR